MTYELLHKVRNPNETVLNTGYSNLNCEIRSSKPRACA